MSYFVGVGLGSITREINGNDVKILEGLSILGPRNLILIAQHLEMPSTSVRYRVSRMLEESVLFLHANPYHSNLGLRTVGVFVEAVLGYEDLLLNCLMVNDYWVYISRIYSPYIGWASVWAVPKDNVSDFNLFLEELVGFGVAKSVEVNWTTNHMGIPIRSRWYSAEEKRWIFNWDEWIEEVETIEGELPGTLRESTDWPMNFDYIDLRIIAELEINGDSSKTDISRNTGISVEVVKYHLREHVLKRDLLEGYQVEVSRYPSLSSESLFFKFEFDDYEKLVKFTLSLKDKPFPIHIAKVIGENALTSHICLPKKEFSKLIKALSTLIRRGLLKTYSYWIQDIFVQFNETIPYKHYESNRWKYNLGEQLESLEALVKEGIFRNHLMKRS